MADPLFSEIFFKGKKQSVVDFLNRGLQGSSVAERVSVQMSGEQIVKLLNDLKENGIGMESYVPLPEIDIHDNEQHIAGTNWCYEHYGCRGPMPFDKWQLLYDQDDMLCLITLLETPEAAPIPFLKYINGLDNVTVYAFGCLPPDGWTYLFHGRLQAVSLIDPYQDRLHAQYLQTLNPDDYEESDMPIEAANMVQEFYMEAFEEELCKEL